MKLKTIQINNFLNKGGDIDWQFNPDVNIISGKIGTGKTSILNCLSILSYDTMKSFKTTIHFDVNRNPPKYAFQELLLNFENESFKFGAETPLELRSYVHFTNPAHIKFLYGHLEWFSEWALKNNNTELFNGLMGEIEATAYYANYGVIFHPITGELVVTKEQVYNLSEGQQWLLSLIMQTIKCLIWEAYPSSCLLVDNIDHFLDSRFRTRIITMLLRIKPDLQLIVTTNNPSNISNDWSNERFFFYL